ncbi:ribonuclease H1 domain-containing protein [Larkinella arboricola]|uniref:Ribonuclease H n=1 Tax=Larkinella arboricola TaxID=643671 RepID=A0A327X0E4_LARAB|nr:ribonuclease H family protein [Larkinella arboricola]RAJ95669.1 ribonuclease HI [Larkinella arboricola]
MAKSPKYYVVWKGRQKGVYDSWEACQEQIQNFPGALYKSFESRAVAEKALGEKPHIHLQGKAAGSTGKEKKLFTGQPIRDSISVDAAWNTATGDMEYQGVHTSTKQLLFHQGPLADGTNNIGEFLAIVHALAWLKQRNSDLPIYSDSRTAISWVLKKKANTKLEETPRNATLFEMLDRAETWLQTNTYFNKILKWETEYWGENPADFGRK